MLITQRPHGPAHQSPFSPLSPSLLISNLPPHVQPKHLTHILSSRPRLQRQVGDTTRGEHGICFIRIYTKPKRKPRPAFFTRLFSDLSISPRANVALAEKPALPARKTSSTSDAEPAPPTLPSDAAALRTRSRVEEVVPDSPRPISTRHNPKQEDEDEVTIAELRFSTEYHRYAAAQLLNRSTIDGRKVGLKMKEWDGAALRRLWRRMT
ncbi:uncharacterized protein MKK02DRAFT_38560 [Dioszegia hungarica]|uniref:Uncharacterized protein n=1 Tax=Dioszegia hungarica TaxID=4972 RepID=A0AA38H503_9TREE|nr:uncharacterized protein MKK02DRAFT_38560 [Dioszegia hungarica]KAI9633890.1 hypothetical protein MKK02DRAFT_38560 [Dioszegia hungarica]